MLLLGVILNVLRPIYLDALPSTVHSHAAAGVVYDTLVSFIRLNLRAVMVVALAVAAGAWIAAPTGTPVALRRGLPVAQLGHASPPDAAAGRPVRSARSSTPTGRRSAPDDRRRRAGLPLAAHPTGLSASRCWPWSSSCFSYTNCWPGRRKLHQERRGRPTSGGRMTDSAVKRLSVTRKTTSQMTIRLEIFTRHMKVRRADCKVRAPPAALDQRGA